MKTNEKVMATGSGQAVGGGAHHSAPTLCRSSLTGAWERPFLPQPEGAGGSEVFGSPPHTSPHVPSPLLISASPADGLPDRT